MSHFSIYKGRFGGIEIVLDPVSDSRTRLTLRDPASGSSLTVHVSSDNGPTSSFWGTLSALEK